MKRRLLSLLLVLTMVFSTLPGNIFAAEADAVSGEANELSFDMRLNQWKDIDLSAYFTYEKDVTPKYFVSDDNETWTELSSAEYRYYPAGDGVQKAYFKAEVDGQESDVLTLTANVAEVPDEVTVTFSVSQGQNGYYKEQNYGKTMFPVTLTVPYFDLALYGLEQYYYNPRCYITHTENDTEYDNNQLAGTKKTAEGVVTVMHVFIYATEVLYLGYGESEAGTGASYKANRIQNAISWTGSVGSSFMNLWNHGTNLNYYIDWNYPLGAPKWGSTSDQEALYGGEDISIHLIESTSASGSSFTFFTADGQHRAESQLDEVTVQKGEKETLTAVMTTPAWEGAFETNYSPYANQTWVWSKASAARPDLTLWQSGAFGGNETLTTDPNGQIVIDTATVEPGTYYIAAKGGILDGGAFEVAPAIIKLNVVCDHEWQDPTCTEPKTCSLCGKTSGKAAGHKWTAATCQAPKTCSVCKLTDGSVDPEAHAFVNGTCSLCNTADPNNTSFTSAPALTGSASTSLLEVQNALYELDLSTVFSQGAWYTVSIDGAEAVSTNKKFSYSCAEPGTHKLVFTASNNIGSGPSYTVTLTVLDVDAVQQVDHEVLGGAIEWFAFTDTSMNPLPEDTTYEWNAETNTFTVTQPADIDLTGKVMVFYKLAKDTPGSKLPLFTGSTALSGAGGWWDSNPRDRQTITLCNGEADDIVYLYEKTPTHAANDFTTVKFDLNRAKPETYFEYKTSGYATYTIAGDKGGVNGHTWITRDEVHIALKDTTPADGKLTFLDQKATTTLTDGAGSYTWGQKTIKYKIDNFPRLADGQETTAIASVPAGTAYTFDLSGMFVDADEADTLSYRVKINNGNMKKFSGSSYTYTPATSATYTLEFFAYDGFVYSEDTFTVTLTAMNMTETFDVTVSNLPEGAKFYYNNGFNTDGTDILGGELDAAYAGGVYTVKVPGNVTCIAIVVDDCRITAEVSEENNAITMQKTSVLVNTKAGDRADGTVSVTYGSGHKAVGKNNVFWLVSGSGYLFEALPSEEFSDRWARGGKSESVTTAAEATITVDLEVNMPKTITVDKDAEVTVYYQWGYYRMYEVEPALEKDNGSTITYIYPCPESQSYAHGYMYFATKGDLIDKAGYMNSVTNTTVTWEGETRTSDHRGTNPSHLIHTERTDDSVMVNINAQNHLVLNPGDTFRLRAFRIWEIINTDTENAMIEPTFTYSGYDTTMLDLVTANVKLEAEGSIQKCGTGGNNWMDMTIKKAGTTFMEVGYEAIHIVDGYEGGAWGGAGGQPGNFLYSACDPARTALIVIQTDGKAATDVSFGIECLSANVGENLYYTGTNKQSWDVEFDTLYFLGEKGEMKFSPSVASGEIESVAVSNDKGKTWTTLNAVNGKYTADIYSGNNILRVTKTDDTTAYQVVRGDQITYTQRITNDLNGNGEVDPGDTVYLKFHGLHNPVGKMSGVYNPGFSHGQRVAYTWNGQQVRQESYHQYSFVTNAEISVTVPADAVGTYALTEGYIHFNVFGDMPGTHRDLTDGGRPVNTTAGSSRYTRSLLPDIVIYGDGAESGVLMGDLTGDGTVDVGDAMLLLQYAASKVTLTEAQLQVANVNKQGGVDIGDATLLLQYVAGIARLP